MTPYEIVKRFFPSADDDEVESILWCCTPFPFVSVQRMEVALQHMANKASTPCHAIELSHQEMDFAWEEAKKAEAA